VVGNEFSFIQIGQPQVFLLRESYPIAPLATNVDLSVSLSPPGKMLSPIPASMMGLEPEVNLSVHTYGIQPGDRIALLSRSFCNVSLLVNGQLRCKPRLNDGRARQARPTHALLAWSGRHYHLNLRPLRAMKLALSPQNSLRFGMSIEINPLGDQKSALTTAYIAT
jgi:hypothetical protein